MASVGIKGLDRRWLLAGGAAAFIGLTGARRMAVPDRLDPARYIRVSRVSGTGYPYRIQDPTGASQLLEAPPQRIASTTFPSDEMLLQIVDQSRVVSICKGSDDAGISNAAGRYGPKVARNQNRLEELIAMQPDFLITGDRTPATTVQLLIASGIKVARFSFYDSFADVDHNTRVLAQLLGVQARGQAVLDDMWRRLAAVETATQGAYAPRLLWYSANGSGSGEGTLNDEMIRRSGARNVAREVGLKANGKMSQELAVSLMPEVIITGEWGTGRQEYKDLLASPAWRDVPAVRNGRVHLINSAWGTTGTPFRVKGVEQLSGILHPDRFAA